MPTSRLPQLVRVYCDESCEQFRYYVIGSLWVPEPQAVAMRDMLDTLKREAGIAHEMKWAKVTRRTLCLAKQIARCTFAFQGVRFSAIIVDKRALGYALHGDGAETRFYGFYRELLFREIACRHRALGRRERYVIHPDERSDRQNERVGELRESLNWACSARLAPDYTPIVSIDPYSWRNDALMQVADLWTGAVGSFQNRLCTSEPKLQLGEEMARCVGGHAADELCRGTAGGRDCFSVRAWPSALGSGR